MKKNPEFLIVGHVCHDVVKDGFIPGGAVTYAAQMAALMGLETRVLTSFGKDFQFKNLFNDVSIVNVPAPETTTFENIYLSEGRTQYLHHRAETISVQTLPNNWKTTPIVFLGPVANEVDLHFLTAFENAIVGVSPQGWMRQWKSDNKIFPKRIDWEKLSPADVVILSEEDIKGMESEVPEMIEVIDLLIITKGYEGAMVYTKGEEKYFPAYPTTTVDATGAGDVFAVSFLLHFFKTKDVYLSIAFAHAAASISVEGVGIQAIGGIIQINKRYHQYLDQYSFIFDS